MASLSTYTTDKASPFTRAVINSMRKLYPEALADKSFDNTGLLLEAPFDPIRRQMNSVLLTIDLTKAVADEAIERKDCVVIAYHPIIFKGLKSLTLADTQQQSLLRLALEGISVYSPHTAVDAVPGGLGDWLADIVTGTLTEPEPETHNATKNDNPKPPAVTIDEGTESSPKSGSEETYQSASSSPESLRPKLPPRPSMARNYSQPKYPVMASIEENNPTSAQETHTRTTIQPSPNPPPDLSSAGMGRLVTFKSPQALTHIIERIARGVGSPAGFPVAIPQNRSIEDMQIRTVAVCAGSGGSVLAGVNADLFFTGELSHHEALAVTEKGAAVVALFHSNTERGFLKAVMKPKLEKLLGEEWARLRKAERGGGPGNSSEAPVDGEEMGEEWDESWEEAMLDESVEVEVSERDRDPYGIVIMQDSEQVGTVLGSVKEEDGVEDGGKESGG